MSTKQSDIFKFNKFFWTFFALWPGNIPYKYYKYFSFIYITINFIIYNILLSINLIHTPRKVELLIPEMLFYFTEVTIAAKVLMMFVYRSKVKAILDLIDCDEFKGDDPETKSIIKKDNAIYKRGWVTYAILGNFGYSTLVILPLIASLIWKKKLELPICKYYFLPDEFRHKYFKYLHIYQSFGKYGHMMYNVNIDSFIAGLMLIAITQMKVLNYKLTNLKGNASSKEDRKELENAQIVKLNACLRHYDILLRYCTSFQDMSDVVLFVQFGMGSIIICVTLYGLLLPSIKESTMFMVSYVVGMLSEIFIPSFLGTQISYQSEKLVDAAYNSEWIPRSEKFKKSLKIFMERAKTPIVLTGLKLFPLSLTTFIWVTKTAYSFLTLVRNVQDRQEGKI
ncbi:odorant receptor 46a [Galleria mellonella]|uniref:Odorant receptor n=1 Tax=Galleria mellonella TaxID=7137 RepID=A0A5C0E4N8_GALME|nr:odorant receptor 46a [Galleria mellonella]QEI46845.1 odorant receptor 29 [Galleria mellonella]